MTCSTCIFWKKQVPQSSFPLARGECEHIRLHDVGGAVYLEKNRDPADGPVLVTDENFGCLCWREKPRLTLDKTVSEEEAMHDQECRDVIVCKSNWGCSCLIILVVMAYAFYEAIMWLSTQTS